MKKIEIKKGDRYGILTVINEVNFQITLKGQKMRRFLCQCDCGVKIEVFMSNLRKKGHTTSCGCLRTKRIVKFLKDGGHYKKHGMWGSLAYMSWAAMKQRCNNPNNTKYYLYGGRGIKICERWFEFEKFFEDMGERTKGMSIDRIDQDGNYTLENCRWATSKEQNNNFSRNRILSFNDKKLTISQWADELNLRPNTISGRLFAGWSIEKAITTPRQIKHNNT